MFGRALLNDYDRYGQEFSMTFPFLLVIWVAFAGVLYRKGNHEWLVFLLAATALLMMIFKLDQTYQFVIALALGVYGVALITYEPKSRVSSMMYDTESMD